MILENHFKNFMTYTPITESVLLNCCNFGQIGHCKWLSNRVSLGFYFSWMLICKTNFYKIYQLLSVVFVKRWSFNFNSFRWLSKTVRIMEKPVVTFAWFSLLIFNTINTIRACSTASGNFVKFMHGWACLKTLVLKVSFNFSWLSTSMPKTKMSHHFLLRKREKEEKGVSSIHSTPSEIFVLNSSVVFLTTLDTPGT